MRLGPAESRGNPNPNGSPAPSDWRYGPARGEAWQGPRDPRTDDPPETRTWDTPDTSDPRHPRGAGTVRGVVTLPAVQYMVVSSPALSARDERMLPELVAHAHDLLSFRD